MHVVGIATIYCCIEINPIIQCCRLRLMYVGEILNKTADENFEHWVVFNHWKTCFNHLHAFVNIHYRILRHLIVRFYQKIKIDWSKRSRKKLSWLVIQLILYTITNVFLGPCRGFKDPNMWNTHRATPDCSLGQFEIDCIDNSSVGQLMRLPLMLDETAFSLIR